MESSPKPNGHGIINSRRTMILWVFALIFAQTWHCAVCGEKLALLSATLRTYQKAACDTDQVVIACPRGTSISIEFAQYNKFIAKDGISIDELCLNTGELDITQGRAKAKHLLRGSTFGSPSQQVPANRYVNAYGMYNMVAPPTPPPPPSLTANSHNNSNNNSTATATSQSGTTDGQLAKNDADDSNSPENCMWPNALQYSLLQTVVEACQKKKHCKFNGAPQYYGLGASGVGDASGSSSYYTSTASSGAISVDPCPKRRKIVEVAYKCRPYEFRSKVACHNDVAQLECNPYSRIAVYSASFGRTEYESIQCPQPQGVREETCLASYATETVMQICHGRRRCNLAADANTFGSPCQPNSRMYLKVVYTCVPKQVLKDRYESDVESDEPEDFEGDLNDLYDEDLHYKESEAIPKLYSNTTTTTSTTSHGNATATGGGGGGGSAVGGAGAPTSNTSSLYDSDSSGGVNPVMTHSADLSLEDDQERLYLYLLIAGFAGVIFCIIVVAVRLVVVQKNDGISGTAADTHSMSSTKGPDNGGGGIGPAGGGEAETTLPNGFNDTISEIDADIDLSGPIPVPSVSKNENYSLYGTTTAASLYGGSHHGPHNPSTLLLQSGSPNSGATSAATGGGGVITNPLLCGGQLGAGGGARQSPDIIGISSNAFVTATGSNGETSLMGPGSVAGLLPLPPGLVIGGGVGIGLGGSTVVSSTPMSCNSSALGTVVPITSLAQYTTAPTFRAGYIIHPEGVLQRAATSGPLAPTSMAPPTAVTCFNQLNQQQLQQFQQQQQQQHHQQQQQQQQQQQLLLATSLPQCSVASAASPVTGISASMECAGGGGGGGAASPALSTTMASNNQLAAGTSATSTLRRSKHVGGVSLLQQHQQPSYDGTAPRTLSTGVPVNSQFYYG